MSENLQKARVLELVDPSDQLKSMYVPLQEVVMPHQALQDEDGLVQVTLAQGVLSVALAPESILAYGSDVSARLVREANLSGIPVAEAFDHNYDLTQTRVYRLADSNTFGENFVAERANQDLFVFFSALQKFF